MLDWFLQRLFVVLMLVGFQLYLAVSNEVIDNALSGVERLASWPVQALNIGLFVLVLVICWLYLQSTRKDLAKLQTANNDERKEYIASLKTLVTESGKVIERNNTIFERIDRKLDRIDERAGREH